MHVIEDSQQYFLTGGYDKRIKLWRVSLNPESKSPELTFMTEWVLFKKITCGVYHSKTKVLYFADKFGDQFMLTNPITEHDT